MEKKEAWCTVILFFGTLFITAILLFALPKKSYSPAEKRYLAERPEFRMEAAKDGSLADGTEEYLADHFPLRSAFVTLYGAYSKAIGHKEIGGAYLCGKGFLMTKLTEEDINPKLFRDNIKALRKFGDTLSEAGIVYRVMLVPSASLSLNTLLPANAPVYRQEEYMDEAAEALGDAFTDTRGALAGEAYYYRSDHHWTTEGAYRAYRVWDDSCGREPVLEEAYEKKTVSRDFLGTLYAKTLTGSTFGRMQPDCVTAYEYPDGIRQIVADGKTMAYYLDEGKMGDRYDAYSAFFGGNHAEMTLSCAGETGSLLVLKDSFANCFLPLLASEFRTVSVLDLRYYNGSVQDYIAAHNITEVLVLYGMDGFMEEQTVRKVGR